MRLLVALALTAALLVAPAPADASGRGIHYGMNAKKVAKKIGCRHAYRPDGGSGAAKYHIKDGVVCRIKGKRVNVITFKNRRGQTRWEDDLVWLATVQGFPEHWASADGVTVVAKNGNRKAACAGRRALRGADNVGAYRATADGWTNLRC